MTDEELKKKLAIFKSAPVPKGYWESYWPRLKMKIDGRALDVTPAKAGAQSNENGLGSVPEQGTYPSSEQERKGYGFRRNDVNFSWRTLVPTFALLLPILIGVFWLGQQSAEKNILRIPHLRLASYEGDEQAKRVFREMLELFPNRVNWISYVDGKVDFSISSVAYKDHEALVPFLLAIPRGKGAFEARVLVRPGQEATAHAPWMDQSTVDLKWHLDALAQIMHVNCRLTAPDWNGSVEGEVRLSPNQGTILGALRWRSQLLQVQLTRLGESSKSSSPKQKALPKADSVQI